MFLYIILDKLLKLLESKQVHSAPMWAGLKKQGIGQKPLNI